MIRQARTDDLPEFQRLTNRAYSPYVPMLGRKPTPMDRDYRPLLAAGCIWIKDDLKGGIVLEAAQDRLLIYSLVVDPDHHGHGIGQALLHFAKGRALEAGVPALRLCTGSTMTRNLEVYSAFGFVETGREDLELPASPTVVWMEMEL